MSKPSSTPKKEPIKRSLCPLCAARTKAEYHTSRCGTKGACCAVFQLTWPRETLRIVVLPGNSDKAKDRVYPGILGNPPTLGVWGKPSLSCKLKLRGSGGMAIPPPLPPPGRNPPYPPPTRNPHAIYNTWARFWGWKIECIVNSARCKSWPARGVAFFVC
jgi:hypothetical protein